MKVNMILTPYLILLLTTNIFMSIQSIDDNDFYIYDITDAGHHLSVGDHLIINEGFGSRSYPVGTKVNATFLYKAHGGIKFQYWVDNLYWVSFYGLNWLNDFGVLCSLRSLYTAYEMIDDYHNGYLTDLSLYNIHPYFDPEFSTYLTSPEKLAEDISNTFTSDWYPNIACLCNYTTIENVLYFESWVGGEVNDNFGFVINEKDNYPSDISFGNNFHFAIDIVNGIVYGFGLRGWVKGIINNLAVDVSLACEYELEGYNLPEYHYGLENNHLLKRNLVVILSTVIPGSVVITISIVFIVGQKSRKKKLQNE